MLDFHRATVDRARSQIEFVVSIAPAMNRIELVRPKVSAPSNYARCVSREIERLLHHIRHMESSKFWKLRRVYVGVKRLLRSPAVDIRL